MKPSHKLDESDIPLLADWYYRPRWRMLWSLPFTVGLMVVIAALLLRSSAEDPRVNFEASKKALLALAPPPVPKEEDAWADYQLAEKAMVPWTGQDELNPSELKLSEPSPLWETASENKYFEAPETQQFWAANAQAIAHLLRAAQNDRCSFGIDYRAQTREAFHENCHLYLLRDSAELLALDARCRALKGDHIGAANSLKAAQRIALHADQRPLLLNSMVSVAIESIAYEALQAILNFSAPHRLDELASYRSALLPQRDIFKRMAESLNTDSAVSLCDWDAVQIGELQLHEDSLVKTLLDPFYYGSDRHCHVAVTNELLTQLRRGTVPMDMKGLVERCQTGPAIVTWQVLPNYSRVLYIYVQTYEERVLTDVALAFIQFRTKYGRDVKTLDELVPEFLSAIPNGAVKGQLVRMRTDIVGPQQSNTPVYDLYKDKPTIRLYAAGPNGRDDGGFTECAIDGKGKDDTVLLLLPLSEAQKERP